MRYQFATEFKFDFGNTELTAYFDESNNLIHVDADDDDFIQLDIQAAEIKAVKEYEAQLKEQEADAKDWENTKWHLNRQFNQF